MTPGERIEQGARIQAVLEYQMDSMDWVELAEFYNSEMTARFHDDPESLDEAYAAMQRGE